MHNSKSNQRIGFHIHDKNKMTESVDIYTPASWRCVYRPIPATVGVSPFGGKVLAIVLGVK